LKTVFHIFIFLAITAFTVDALSVFVVKNVLEEQANLADPDDKTDTDTHDSADSDGEEEEGETPVKELFFEGIATFTFEFAASEDKAFFSEISDLCKSHFIVPPYSPPEFV
jgi:hypothetical protein